MEKEKRGVYINEKSNYYRNMYADGLNSYCADSTNIISTTA